MTITKLQFFTAFCFAGVPHRCMYHPSAAASPPVCQGTEDEAEVERILDLVPTCNSSAFLRGVAGGGTPPPLYSSLVPWTKGCPWPNQQRCPGPFHPGSPGDCPGPGKESTAGRPPQLQPQQTKYWAARTHKPSNTHRPRGRADNNDTTHSAKGRAGEYAGPRGGTNKGRAKCHTGQRVRRSRTFMQRRIVKARRCRRVCRHAGFGDSNPFGDSEGMNGKRTGVEVPKFQGSERLSSVYHLLRKPVLRTTLRFLGPCDTSVNVCPSGQRMAIKTRGPRLGRSRAPAELKWRWHLSH